jgi:adenylyl-sulfate kinase
VLIDGDRLRVTAVSLGFSKLDRHANVVRAARLARAAVVRGAVAVCALISPYREARDRARQIVGRRRFVEVFVNAPLDVCEARDTKGLYARARAGEITNLTGINDPYEPPPAPDLVLDAAGATVADNVSTLLALLTARRFLEPAPHGATPAYTHHV